jgi:hypothetical protein
MDTAISGVKNDPIFADSPAFLGIDKIDRKQGMSCPALLSQPGRPAITGMANDAIVPHNPTALPIHKVKRLKMGWPLRATHHFPGDFGFSSKDSQYQACQQQRNSHKYLTFQGVSHLSKRDNNHVCP